MKVMNNTYIKNGAYFSEQEIGAARMLFAVQTSGSVLPIEEAVAICAIALLVMYSS